MNQPNERMTSGTREWRAGDRETLDRIFPELYPQLYELASKRLLFPNLQSISPGTLVHEAYLRLCNVKTTECESTSHFWNLAARIMRCILVDHLRKQRMFATLIDLPDESANGIGTVLDVDNALAELEKLNPSIARIVELRFFAGLSIEKTADAMGISAATVKRHWLFARAWMLDWISNRGGRAE